VALEFEIKGGKVFLNGSIDESANLENIFLQFSGDVLINMKDVKNANSIGLRSWIQLLSDYSSRHKVTIEALPYGLAVQARLIRNLFGKGTVLTTMAPYFCPSCEKERLVEIAGTQVMNSQLPPPAKCAECSGEMDFDELPQFFDFLRSRAG
jgi:hypothetical protein